MTFTGIPLFASPSDVALAQEVSRYTWENDAEHFGGFSGLELGPNGVEFTTISDRTWFVQGQIIRDANGRIVGIESQHPRYLTPPDGQSWHRLKADSEGLAVGPDGNIFVSFEGMHRVLVYSDLDENARMLPAHPGFEGMISNSSLEALAIDADGTIYTLPERSGHLERPFPIFRFRSGEWQQPFGLPREDDFLPVGADFGPDGKLYLLERKFQMIRGFSNRVRRFTVTETGLQDEELMFESKAGEFSNLEGLSVWQGSDGQIRLTMISDDNFNFFQTTEVVEFKVLK